MASRPIDERWPVSEDGPSLLTILGEYRLTGDTSNYLVFDRHQLAYLNFIEKLNCAYCSYANGVIAFAREVAARTEVYWCPIKHARRILGPHPHYQGFADFGDAEGFRKQLSSMTNGVIIDEA